MSAKRRRLRILFVASSLRVGGAERQLVLLARLLAYDGHDVRVATFYPGGALEAELAVAGVQLIHLWKRGRRDIVPFLRRLAGAIREVAPDIVHPYLVVPNVACSIATPLAGLRERPRVVWGVRTSRIDVSLFGWGARAALAAERAMSRFADLIIVNSQAGAGHHSNLGYPTERLRVIVNGIDDARFFPSQARRAAARGRWDVSEETLIIGMVARFDPLKGHSTFLKAAERIAPHLANVRFVVVSMGAADAAQRWRTEAANRGLAERVIWEDGRGEIAEFYNGFDVFTLPSLAEGFPNVVGEAMATGLPCVVTDVGDAADLVGDTGIVVKAGDAEGLARGWQRLAAMSPDERRALGDAALARSRQRLGLDRLRDESIAAFDDVLRDGDLANAPSAAALPSA